MSRRPGSAPRPLQLIPLLPCQRAQELGISWTSYDDRHAAAEQCAACGAATSCLLAALRLDAAARRGRDPYGATGVWGGTWFNRGHAPRRAEQ